MYAHLDEALCESAPALQAHALHLDQILAGHYARRFVLALTRDQAARIREAVPLGAMSQTALALITRRADDYGAAARQSERTLLLCGDDAIPSSFEISGGRSIKVKLSGFCAAGFVNASPQLLVENIVGDARAVDVVFRLGCLSRGLPYDLVKYSVLNGGGSGLAHVISALEPGNEVAVSFSDRDSHPFKLGCSIATNGTAAAAMASAVERNLIATDAEGPSSIFPYFAFLLTGARTVEGAIGPRCYEIYFNANPGVAQARQCLLQAFSHFPNLSLEEWVAWHSLNLKDGKLRGSSVKQVLVDAGLSAQQISTLELTRLADARVPGSALPWMQEQLQTGRFRRALLTAFKEDCGNPQFRLGAEQLWCAVWTFLAADRRAAFS